MKRIILCFILLSAVLKGDIILSGSLHPGDNESTSYTPADPLTKVTSSWWNITREHTYSYYTNHPSRFYLTSDINITGIELLNPQYFEPDSNLRVYIDGTLVATGNNGATSVALNLSLSKGMHTIAVTGSCYKNQVERDCNDNPDDIDDFHFSGIKLLSAGDTKAYNFIQKHHIGDDDDSDDDYDIDDDELAYYPDSAEGNKITYNLNITTSLVGFRLFISRMRDVHENGINKVNIYDKNSQLIVFYDINHSDTGMFDMDEIVDHEVDGVSKIEIVSGSFSGGNGLDDLSFDEFIFIPYETQDEMYEEMQPIVDYRMDECEWDSDNSTYEVKNYGTLGNDVNATTQYDANNSDGGIICKKGDFRGSKHLIPKNEIPLKEKYTITTWIQFPLDSTNHQTYTFCVGGVGWWCWGGTYYDYQYYNIADREGKNESFIFFQRVKEHSSSNWQWQWCVDDYDGLPHCTDFTMPNGWKHVAFVNNGIKTTLYLNGEPDSSVDYSLQNIDLNRIGASDFNNDTSGQTIGAFMDEYKIFDRALTQTLIQDIYTNEQRGDNWDGNPRTCPDCNQEQNETLNFKFDAWDTFRSINDRNISTKIVGKEFNLTIASMDENGSDFQEFNGTVCVKIDTDIQKTLFQNEREKNLSFEITRAIKDIRVDISWKKNVDENCPLSNEDNSTLSTDNFAIRPDRFEIVPTPPYYAGDDFNISFYAKDYNSSDNTTDYNESYNVSFKIESNETKPGCKSGSITVDDFNFTNGVAEDINASYDEIGEINITIEEINGSEFARVDEDDTNDSQRLIKKDSKIIYVEPYEINVTDVNFTVSTEKKWLYMVKDSNISEMNVTVRATLSVYSKKGELLDDFNETCYGKDVEVQFHYDVNNTNGENNITLVSVGSTSDNGTLADINKSVNFEKSLFSNGKATKTYAFDINRSFDEPLSPIFIQLKNVKITSSGIAKELHDANQTGKIKSEQNATFYYARVYTEDLTTSKSTDIAKVYILVYDDKQTPYTKDFNQTLLNWYMNSWHNDGKEGKIVVWKARKGVSLDTESVDVDVNPSLNSGYWDIALTHNSDDEAYIHLDISPWLWFSYSRDFFYSFEPNSTCAQHPCIHYRYSKDHEKSGVESGNVGGTNFEQNVSKRNRGVKIFR